MDNKPENIGLSRIGEMRAVLARKFVQCRRNNRLQVAVACGLAGWVVSFGMAHWGGDMARYLPNQWFHTAALWGAMVAGYVLASGFGRKGWPGWVIAAVCACVATVLGAVVGAGTIGLFAVGDPSQGAFLGVIAIADAATSVWLAVTWVIAMAGVDAYARWVMPRLAHASGGLKRFLG